MEEKGGESCHTIEDPTEEAAEEPQSNTPVHPQEKSHRPKRSWIVFAGIIAALSLFLIVASAVSYNLVGSSANSVYLADGATVYVAGFNTGNQTTTVSEGAVCDGFGTAPCSGDGIMLMFKLAMIHSEPATTMPTMTISSVLTILAKSR